MTLVHRRDELRAERILVERLTSKSNVDFVWNSVVDEIVGAGTPRSVTGVRLKNVVDGEMSELKADGVFVAIGHAPATDLFDGQLNMKPNGYLWTRPGSTVTNVAGVFAAGDVTDDTFRQAVTAAGMGCMAALEVERWLSGSEAVK